MTTDYQSQSDRECECCRYPAPLAELHRDDGTAFWLCQICASTPLASCLTRQMSPDIAGLYQAVGWIGNMLREKKGE